MNQFHAPEESLGNLDAEVVAKLLMAAADIALVIDGKGVIKDLACDSEQLSREHCDHWLGRQWQDIVTVESRPKVAALMQGEVSNSPRKGRQVNHPSTLGSDLPVLYSTVALKKKGNVVAVGRNLQSVANLQQRLVEVQQTMERDYSRLRHMETRYRLLFKMVSEAVLIVDTATRRVVEANPAALRILGEKTHRLVGQVFPQGFADQSIEAIQSMLTATQLNGRTDDIKVSSTDGKREFFVSATLFRQEDASLFLIRISSVKAETSDDDATSKAKTQLVKIVENAPEGFVVTDPQGAILTANSAFLELAQLATEEQAKGESLDRWLGRPGIELTVLMKNLKEHGSVRLFATILHGEYGSNCEVELSAVAVLNGDPPCLGFMIRNIGRRLADKNLPEGDLPRTVEQLTELVGRVPLKDLVRETTDIIERLCIEAALKLTSDNRASAAEVLGLSRQSLYDKLKRYGLADSTSDNQH